MRKYLTNKRYLLGIVLSALFFAGVSFFFEGRSNLISNDAPFFTNYEFLFSFIALFVLEFVIWIVAKRSFQIKANFGLALFLILFFAASVTAILLYDGVEFNGEIIGTISNTYKIRYILLAFILYLSTYEIIVIIPKLLAGKRLIRYIFFIAVVVGVVATVYSFVNENEFYTSFLNGQINFEDYLAPQSYTSHKNIYGLVLFFALISEAFLDVERPHWWRWFIILYFYVQQFLVMSKTCLFISSLFVICFAVYSFVRSLKTKSPSRAAYILLFVVATVILCLVLFLNGSTEGFLGSTYRFGIYLKEELFSMSKASLKTRIISIEIPFDAIKGNIKTLLFGFGYGNEYRALGCFSYGDPNVYSVIDNAWGLTLAQGGMFGIIYSALMWAGGFVLIAHAFSRKSRYSFFSLFVYICLLGRTMTENDNLSYLDFAGVCYFAFSLLPLLIEETRKVDKKVAKQIQVNEKPAPISSYLGRAFSIAFVPSLFLIALTRKIGYMQNIPYLQSLLLRYGGIILFFVSPIVLGAILIALKQKKKGLGIFALFIYLFYVATIFVLPLFTQSRLMLIPELSILAFDVFVLSMGGIYERKYFSIGVAFVNYLLFSVVCGLTYFMFRNFTRSVTFFSLFAILAFYFSLWIFIYFTPRRASILAPFERTINFNENKYLNHREKKERLFEEKTKRIIYDHPIR